MSAIYNLEPQPTASAIVHTTLGEILVELFAKQTPLTCRNFLQLSLDGYYDGTVFHRLVPGFVLQGGDPTGTGNGGESIYDGGAFSGDHDPWPMDQRSGHNAGHTGINFKDEFHSRLKFTRRGLLAMANEGRPNTNGSQFFFTLNKTEDLNGKNTLFGRVAGDTIYNLMKIGEAEVDQQTERPLYPAKILRVEILVNPFADMEKRSRVVTYSQPKASVSKEKKQKRKAGKQLLSFGDDEGDEVEPVFKKTKFDTRLIAGEDTSSSQPASRKPPQKSKLSEKKHGLEVRENKPSTTTSTNREAHAPKEPGVRETNRKDRKDKKRYSPEQSVEPEPSAPAKSALEEANEELEALKASMRRTIHDFDEQTTIDKVPTALEALIPENSLRGRKRRPGGNAASSDDPATLRMFKEFRSKLEKAPPKKSKVQAGDGKNQDDTGSKAADEEPEICDLHFISNCQSCTSWDKQEKEESDDEGWMSHTLSFAADKLGKDLTNRRKAEEELVVIDPREKARTLKEEKRAQREARAGNSGRAWDQARDQARNADLARAASLSGRGAK